jgi:hypothetical protein
MLIFLVNISFKYILLVRFSFGNQTFFEINKYLPIARPLTLSAIGYYKCTCSFDTRLIFGFRTDDIAMVV